MVLRSTTVDTTTIQHRKNIIFTRQHNRVFIFIMIKQLPCYAQNLNVMLNFPIQSTHNTCNTYSNSTLTLILFSIDTTSLILLSIDTLFICMLLQRLLVPTHVKFNTYKIVLLYVQPSSVSKGGIAFSDFPMHL